MLKDRPRLPSCLLGKHWPQKEDCLSAALGPLTLQETRVKLGAESLQVKNFRHPLTVPGCTGLFRNFVQAFFHLIFFLIIVFTYLFLAVLGLGCCTGFSLVVVRGPLTGVASLVTEHGL